MKMLGSTYMKAPKSIASEKKNMVPLLVVDGQLGGHESWLTIVRHT